MLRVITGSLKGRKLFTLAGKDVRPTADRLRESIFNLLLKYPPPQTVVDLFAGTGALGIEAMSRGAEFCLFVDVNPRVIDLLQKNIRICGLENRSALLKQDIGKSLNRLQSLGRPADLVFMDPPYNQGLVARTLGMLFQSPALSDGAVIVVEHAATEPLPDPSPGFQVLDQRRYGQSVVSFLGRMG